MRPRAPGVVAVCALALATVAGGCSVLTHYEDFTGGALDASVAEAGPLEASVLVDAGSLTEQTLCSPNIPPPPDAGTPTPTITSETTFFGVMSAFRFVAEDGGCPIIGKNLDNLVTCPGPPACTPSYGDMRNCDIGDGGIDNAGPLQVFNPSNLQLSMVDLTDELPADVAAQRTGFVLSVTNYGGEQNNPQVTVDYYSDVGVADGGGTLVDEAALSSVHRVLVEDTSAYVTNGVLVATFPGVKVPFHLTIMFTDEPGNMYSLVFPLSNASIIGVPVLRDGGFTINDGQLVGRIVESDLAMALSNLYACIDQSAAGLVCSTLDLTASPNADGTGAPCDAISVAFGFDLAPTTYAGTATAIPPRDLCTTGTAPLTVDICTGLPLVDGGGSDGDAAP